MNGSPEQNLYDQYWNRQKILMASAHVNNAIIAACVILFIAGFFIGEEFDVTLALDSFAVVHGEGWYTLFTAVFLHASIRHLFSNMLILLLLGAEVERDTGHVAYLILYLASGIIGNIVSVLWDYLTVHPTISVGASGAVFGVTGALLVSFLKKNRQRRLIRTGRGLAAESSAYTQDTMINGRGGSSYGTRLIIMVIYMLYSGFTQSDINNAAHVGGFITGAIITLICSGLSDYRRN